MIKTGIDNFEHTGPIRARVLHFVTTTSNPADVTAIGRAEVEFCGREIRIHAVGSREFVGDQLTCSHAALLTEAVEPSPVDVLVAHDVSRALELLPACSTGAVSWIGSGRLLAMTKPSAPVYDPEAVVAWMGLTSMLDSIPIQGGRAARQAAATALLLREIRRFVGGGVTRMIRLSRCLTRPLCKLPELSDDRGWTNLPTDELRWLATYEQDCTAAGIGIDPGFGGDVSARAMREWNRRRIWACRY